MGCVSRRMTVERFLDANRELVERFATALFARYNPDATDVSAKVAQGGRGDDVAVFTYDFTIDGVRFEGATTESYENTSFKMNGREVLITGGIEVDEDEDQDAIALNVRSTLAELDKLHKLWP